MFGSHPRSELVLATNPVAIPPLTRLCVQRYFEALLDHTQAAPTAQRSALFKVHHITLRR